MHIVLIVTFISAVFCYYIAKLQGKSRVQALLLGIVFGPFAIPAVLFMIKKKNNNE